MENIFTAILFTYNHKDTFRGAIESVLNQKTNFDFKIIVLDDASNDGTTDIVKEYANKYPERITAIINPVNMDGKYIREVIRQIKTKYFAILETDDYWCDENKIQTQIDILENNPDCSMCAHNTLRNYVNQNKTENYLNSPTKIYTLPKKKLTNKYYIEPHTSSRVYRTSSINFDELGNEKLIIYDVTSVFYILTKGNLYYINKVMSVYNYTQKGKYSSQTSYKNRYSAAKGIYELNKTLNFKYNYLLARFFATRLNLNFVTAFRIKNCKNTIVLDKIYKKILSNFEERYFGFYDRKPICLFKIPVGHKRKLVFELSREKPLCK